MIPSNILVIGLDQVAHKSLQLYADMASYLAIDHIEVRSRDFAGRSQEFLDSFSSRSNYLKISKSYGSVVSEIKYLLFKSTFIAPNSLIHLYLAERNLTLFAQVFLLVLFKRKYDVICRGGELYRYDSHHPSAFLDLVGAQMFQKLILSRDLCRRIHQKMETKD